MNAWEEIKPWVAKLAPMLGTALGGPLGGAAGAILSQALGTKDASPESIKAAITTGTLTGNQIVALKQAENEFALQMAALDIKSVQDLEQLEFQDRDSARNREIKTGDSWTPRILAGVVVLSWVVIQILILINSFHGHVFPEPMIGPIMRVLGTLDMALGMALAYYFGGNHHDQSKAAMLYNSTPGGV